MDGHEHLELTAEQAASTISPALRTARKHDTRLHGFPGPIPSTLEDAYAIQARSIEAWPEDVVGWKVGGVPLDFQDRFEDKRLVGPVFSNTVQRAPAGGVVRIPAYKGFVAVEAEWVFELGDCSALPENDLTEHDVLKAVRAAYIGIEIASSPIIDINSYGPAVIISDFGNNHGLIIGAPVDDWSSGALSEVPVSVEIDGKTVGEGPALPGLDGPLGAVKFLLEHMARYGRGDVSGQFVCSGALTGVHETSIGAESVVRFDGKGEIALDIVPITQG